MPSFAVRLGMRTSVPLSEAQIVELAERFGPYLYHDTPLDPFTRIIAEGCIRPPTEEERRRQKSPLLRPRPGAVYFRLPVPRPAGAFLPEAVVEMPFRVSLASIDRDAFLIDEDRVCDWRMGRDKLPLPTFSEVFEALPSTLCSADPFQPVDQSLGEWVDAAADDRPQNVWASALRGTLAVRGAVSVGVEANLGHPMADMIERRTGDWVALDELAIRGAAAP